MGSVLGGHRMGFMKLRFKELCSSRQSFFMVTKMGQ